MCAPQRCLEPPPCNVSINQSYHRELPPDSMLHRSITGGCSCSFGIDTAPCAQPALGLRHFVERIFMLGVAQDQPAPTVGIGARDEAEAALAGRHRDERKRSVVVLA